MASMFLSIQPPAPTGADKLLLEVHGPRGLLKKSKNAGMARGEEGVWEDFGWKP